MEIFDVFSMNGIENNPASGDIFLENVILKVSQTHFSRISICPPLAKPRGGINFSRGGNAPPRGGREVPCCQILLLLQDIDGAPNGRITAAHETPKSVVSSFSVARRSRMAGQYVVLLIPHP